MKHHITGGLCIFKITACIFMLILLASCARTINPSISSGKYQILQLTRCMQMHSPIRHIAFSPDGRIIGGTGKDGTIWLWNSNTGKRIGVLKGHSDLVKSITFSLDGKYIASNDCRGYVVIWNAKTLKLIRKIKGADDAVAFSPRGNLLIGRKSSGFNIWQVDPWTLVKSIPASTGNFMASLAISPDGALLTSRGANGALTLWSVDTGNIVYQVKGLRSRAASFSPDGKLLASASRDNRVKIWDVKFHRYTSFNTAYESTAIPWCTSFSKDGRMIVTGIRVQQGIDGKQTNTFNSYIVLQDVKSGEVLQTIRIKYPGIESIAFSPDGRYLAASFIIEGLVMEWSVATSK